MCSIRGALMSTIENNETKTQDGRSVLPVINNKADIENFYRFVFDNDLRREAKMALSEIYKVIKPKKSRRGRKKGSKNKVQ
tara:strand:+ start:442 stop:684 length:243 start_codon:yes stop_codon:yes gene_type:complete